MGAGVLTRPGQPGSRDARVQSTSTLTRRRAWWLLSGWTLFWALVHTPGGGYSWHYFSLAARLLTGSGPASGLHVYAAHPELQIGPLAMAVAVPIRALDPALGRVIAPLLLTATGPLLLAWLVRARERYVAATSPLLLLSSGVLLLPVWTEVTTHYTHLDDVLALAFAAGAAVAARYGSAPVTGLLLAAAVDSKPWAAGFAALLLVLPRHRRAAAVVVLAVGVAVAWLPFILGDPGTLSLTHFSIDNVDDSALRALGVTSAGTPSWDRPAQLLLGLTAAVLALRRGRWQHVLLVVVAARLLLDPETYPYYTSGLVLAAVVADLFSNDRRLPLWTLGTASWYVINEFALPIAPPAALGFLRLAVCLTLLVAASLLPARPELPSGDLR
ncbi:MAG: hypothetical protein JWM02_722 [Frankiales bacterium]|nr:hypothetical protein [Frankiales bacterium]